MTIESLNKYFLALDRLKQGRPKNVPRGTKITNDAVSLEAGRKKGSIKRSRPQFNELIAAIDTAAGELILPQKVQATKLDSYKKDAQYWKEQYEAALGRELSLLKELLGLKQQLQKLTGDKILPLRKKQPAK